MARREKPRTLRKDRKGRNPVIVGLLVIVAVALVTYFGFTKDNPFSRGFQFQAVFPSANSIRLGSPVRIAGVNVGTVKKIEGQDGTNNAVLTMEMKDEALPIHKDARLKIRPRIFLEGNFFVDLQPGTPSAPTISDGDTVPVDQTATPVQLDQVLTALQKDTRTDLQTTLEEFGAALNAKPTLAQDLRQPAVTRGKTAAEALNSALTFGPQALKSSAIVTQALQGQRPSDLTELVRGLAGVGDQLAGSERQLAEWVQNFNTTMGALAAEQSSLSASVAELGPTVRTAYDALGSLNESLPAVRQFAVDFAPGVAETPATIAAVTPWIQQALPLVGPDELGGLLADLQPATANLAQAEASGIQSLKLGESLAVCGSKILIPAVSTKLDDGALSSGKENYKEFWYALTGFNGSSQNFDGNGQVLRTQTGGGPNELKLTGGNLQNGLPLLANGIAKPLGTKPAFPGVNKVPPLVATKACRTQTLPDFKNTPVGPPDAG
jgi:virulence factor Mce-like protein